MVDPRQRRPATPEHSAPDLWSRRGTRLALWALGILGVAAIAFVVVQAVRESATEDRWEELWKVRRQRDAGGGPSWLYEAEPSTVAERGEFVERLEKLLPEVEEDPVVAAQVHATIANLEGEQLLALAGSGPFDARRPHYDAAIAHLRTLLERYPDAPLARSQFAPAGYVSEAHRFLATLEKDRAWDERHAIRDAAPDADPVVLLRTEAGDVRLRLFGADAKGSAERFVKRVCAGELDGTRIFERRHGDDESSLRAGGARTRAEAASEADRAKWVEPTEAPTLAPDPSRDRIVHRRGVVTSWRDPSSAEDDPEQFALVVRDSPALDHERTPFAKATEEASLATLDRIFARATFADETPDIASIEERRALADQLKEPVRIVKALVYEKGALSSCHDATKVRESEKRLETVKADEDLKEPPPPPPPSPPAAPASPPAAPPAAPDAPGAEPPAGTEPPAMDAAR